MAEYTIVPRDETSFEIHVVGDDGARHTMLGFTSQAEAEDWIETDRRAAAVNLLPLEALSVPVAGAVDYDSVP